MLNLHKCIYILYICVYMYTCLNIYIYTCIGIFMYVYIYPISHVNTSNKLICTYIRMYICIYIYQKIGISDRHA